MSLHHLPDLGWDEVVAVAPGAIAVLPVGSQEQHGGHLPLGTDTMLVEAVLDEALAMFESDEHPTLVRLPALNYGHSPHHQFRAAISLNAETLLHVVNECLDSLHTCGFRRVLVVNGHAGNTEILSLAVKQFALRAPVAAATCNYWAVGRDECGTRAGSTVVAPGHAGWFETSLMLAVRPEVVRTAGSQPAPTHAPMFIQPVHPGVLVASSGEWERVGGLTDDPATANVRDGNLILDRRIHGLVAAIRAFDTATTA